MPSLLEELVENRAQISDSLEALTSAEDFDPNDPQIGELQGRAERIEAQISHVEKVSAMRQSADSIAHRIGRRVTRVPNVDDPDDLGAQVAGSAHFQAWKRNGASGRAKLLEFDTRALVTTVTVPSQKDRIYAASPAQQATLLASVNRIQVSSGSVEIVTYPAADPLAGKVPEGTLKPEAPFTIAVSTVTLDTLAHWIEATRQVIEDEARLRDFISNTLLRGVLDKAETEAAAAIGAGVGYATATADSMLKALRIGIAQVNSAGYRPSVILMNPLDAATLDYEVWQNGNGAPAGVGGVWGVPVVPNGTVPAGTAYVADGQVAWHHYYRGIADLFVSDSDVGPAGESNFKRNILTFLGEYRGKTVVVRPEAVSKATVTTPLGDGGGGALGESDGGGARKVNDSGKGK